MPDFTSGIWSWFIGIITVISIFALAIFTYKQSTGKGKKEGEQPETMGHVWDENLEEYNNPMPKWWLNLFYITLVWGIVYLIMYPGLGAFSGMLKWTQQKQYNAEIESAETEYGPIFNQYLGMDLKQVAQDPTANDIGKRLFSTYCTTCHGSDARGARGFPNLRDDEWLYGSEPQMIKTSIMNGRQGLMPAWDQLLSYEDIFNTTAYIEQLAGREVDNVTASKGKLIYDTNCAVCHGQDGSGNQQLGAPNLTNEIWLYGGSQKKIMESISQGRKGNMPPHKEFLGEAKVHLLAAYVYSMGKE